MNSFVGRRRISIRSSGPKGGMDRKADADAVVASLATAEDIHDFLRVCYTGEWSHLDGPTSEAHALRVFQAVLGQDPSAERVMAFQQQYRLWQIRGPR